MKQQKLKNVCRYCKKSLGYVHESKRLKVCRECIPRFFDDEKNKVYEQFIKYPTEWEDSDDNPDNNIADSSILLMLLFGLI